MTATHRALPGERYNRAAVLVVAATTWLVLLLVGVVLTFS